MLGNDLDKARLSSHWRRPARVFDLTDRSAQAHVDPGKSVQAIREPDCSAVNNLTMKIVINEPRRQEVTPWKVSSIEIRSIYARR